MYLLKERLDIFSRVQRPEETNVYLNMGEQLIEQDECGRCQRLVEYLMVEVARLDGHLNLLHQHAQLLRGRLRRISAGAVATGITAAVLLIEGARHASVAAAAATVALSLALVQILLRLQRLHVADRCKVRIVAAAANVIDQIGVVLVVLRGKEIKREVMKLSIRFKRYGEFVQSNPNKHRQMSKSII